MFKKLALFLFFLTFVPLNVAAKIETIKIQSQAMNKEIPAVVISHEHFTEVGCPVIYLLHGYAGDEKSWSIIQPKLEFIANRYNLIFVCPYGADDWYLNSPFDKSIQYETFLSSELVNYIDAHYPTGNNKTARAITGFSMGGYGAIRIAILYPEIFGAAGSTSGAFDLINLPSIPIDTSPRKDFNISAVLGTDKKLWHQYSLFNLISKTQTNFPSMIID
jgi:S-formylglutathione hydrolase FrmB